MTFSMKKMWSVSVIGVLAVSLTLRSMKGNEGSNKDVVNDAVGHCGIGAVDIHAYVKRKLVLPEIFGIANKGKAEGGDGCTCGRVSCHPCDPPAPPCASGMVARYDFDDDDDLEGDLGNDDPRGVCVACGGQFQRGLSQLCCDNHKCDPGFTCNLQTKRCDPCGGIGNDLISVPADLEGEPCCPAPARICDSGFFSIPGSVPNSTVQVRLACNSNNRCEVCGYLNGICCDGMKCTLGLELNNTVGKVCNINNVCGQCGRCGTQCCAPPSAPCITGHECGIDGLCHSSSCPS